MNEQTLQTKLNSKSIGYFLGGFCLVVLIIIAWYSIPKICAQIKLEGKIEERDKVQAMVDNRSIEYHEQAKIISGALETIAKAQAMQVKLHEENEKDREVIKQMNIEIGEQSGLVESK